MSNEIYGFGREHNQPVSLQHPEELLHTSAPEIVPPPAEYPPLPDEFAVVSSQSADSEAQSNEHKRKNKTNHNMLVRMMVYGVACFLSVIILSTTLYNEEIRENVIAAGGSVTGDLRFTIQWNDIETNLNDFDAHCVEPSGYRLHYSNREYETPTGGTLDVDIVQPGEDVAIENIVYEDRGKLENGEYILSVQCFSNNGYDGGFRAQVEINGRIYNFEYDEPMQSGEYVVVAIVTVRNGRLSIEPKINSKVFW